MFSTFEIQIVSQYLISVEEFVFLMVFIYWTKLLHGDVSDGHNGLSKAMLFFVVCVLLGSSSIQFLAILFRMLGMWTESIVLLIVLLRLTQKSIALYATVHFMKVYQRTLESEDVNS